MEIEAVQGEGMPRALGPYSHVVRAGDLFFIAGQSGVDPATGEVPTGGFEAEARMALVNLGKVLRAAGLDLNRVVKTTVFLTSVDDFAAMNALYAEAFPTAPPVR